MTAPLVCHTLQIWNGAALIPSKKKKKKFSREVEIFPSTNGILRVTQEQTNNSRQEPCLYPASLRPPLRFDSASPVCFTFAQKPTTQSRGEHVWTGAALYLPIHLNTSIMHRSQHMHYSIQVWQRQNWAVCDSKLFPSESSSLCCLQLHSKLYWFLITVGCFFL